MTGQDFQGFRIITQCARARSVASVRNLVIAIFIFLMRDIKLFFRPVRIPVIAHLLLTSILFVVIGAIGVGLQFAADAMARHDVPSEFGTSLRYLAQLVIWLDVMILVACAVVIIAKQVRAMVRVFGS